MLDETPTWRDRPGYLTDYGEMGHVFSMLANFRANYDGYHFPHVDSAILLAVGSNLTAPLYNEGNVDANWPTMVNHNFPAIAAALDTRLTNANFYKTDLWMYGLVAVCGYEDDWSTVR